MTTRTKLELAGAAVAVCVTGGLLCWAVFSSDDKVVEKPTSLVKQATGAERTVPEKRIHSPEARYEADAEAGEKDISVVRRHIALALRGLDDPDLYDASIRTIVDNGMLGIKVLFNDFVNSPNEKVRKNAVRALNILKSSPATYELLRKAAVQTTWPEVAAAATKALSYDDRTGEKVDWLHKEVGGLHKDVKELDKKIEQVRTAEAPKPPTAKPEAPTPTAPVIVANPEARSSIDSAVARDNEARRRDRIEFLQNEILDDEGVLSRWKNAQRSVIDPDIKDIRRGEIRQFEQKLNNKKRELVELERK